MEKLFSDRRGSVVDRRNFGNVTKGIDDKSGFVTVRTRSRTVSELPVSKLRKPRPKLELRAFGVECAESVFSRMRQSVLVVDVELNVLWRNRTAERFLATRHVLCVSDGRLGATDRREFAQLRRWIVELVSSADDARCEAVTSLRDVRTGRFCEIAACKSSVYECPPRTRDLPVAILFVSDPEQQVSIPPSVLNSLFGLTECEQRLARGLLNGHGLDRYAAEAGIKVSTARTHLKSIFRKTDTKSQAALVTLLSRLVPPVSVDGGDV